MSLTTIILIAGSAWSILSISVAVPSGRAMKRADRRPRADVINWMPVLPPVPPPVTPPFTQTVPSADWFDGMPVEILSDDAIHSLFDSIVDGEFS